MDIALRSQSVIAATKVDRDRERGEEKFGAKVNKTETGEQAPVNL